MTAPEIDPTEALSANLNRRVFVGLSAGAALAVSNASAASGAQFGEPHRPLVAEDDPSITVDRVDLKVADVTIPAYAASPKEGGPHTPSVVVIMHIWGMDSSIRDVVRRLAKAGFAAIAPDLYGRLNAPSGDGATDYTIFRGYAQRLDRKEWLGDVRAAVEWLKVKFPSTKTGIMGFCMGGHLLLIAISEEGALFAAAAPFYGAVAGIDPATIRVPVCGSYGGRDTGIPPPSVRAFAAALTVPNDLRIYDQAGHAFFDDERASYVASAAEDAWRRTIAFFTEYLRAPAT